MRTRMLLPASLALLALSFARGQAPATPVDVQPEPPVTETVPPPVAEPIPATQPPPAPPAAPSEVVIHDEVPGSVTRSRDTLSVDFPDEEIRNILRNVADLFELNLVIPETLQGRTSIKLRDVTWRQIFQVVLSPVGYTFIEEGNIIKVVSQDVLLQEPVTTEVFILNYAKATDIKPTIDGLVEAAAGGKLLVDVRSNALVITERPSRMTRIRVIIEQLDKATEQVMIESKFVEVSNDNMKELGLEWEAIGGFGIGALQGRGKDRAADKNTTTTVTNGSAVSSTLDTFTRTKESFVTTAVMSGLEFDSVLKALQTDSRTKLVSNPTVVTLNNVEASINIGNEYPIPNYTYNQERGTFEVSGFTYRPIGIILKVTPQVNAQGFIRLNLEPEVSSQNGVSNFGGAGGAEIPIISVRKAKTQVSLADGHTMAIGGLIDNTTTKGVKRLPILGDIPGLGRLFRSDTNTVLSRNLIVFITAKSVSAENAKVEEIIDPRAIKDMELRRDELPGYRSSSEDPFYTPPPPPAPTSSKKPFFRLTKGEAKS